MARILVTSRSFGTGDRPLRRELEQAGHEVVDGPVTHGIAELGTLLPEVDAWIAGTGPVTREHLARARSLQVLARYGVGVESVDLAAAAEHGVVVTSTPGANTEAVADHAVALMLAALRSVVPGDRRVRAGDWSTVRGRQLGSLRVALIGFGRIGRAVARRLGGFGSELLVVDPMVAIEEVAAAGARPVTLEDAAREADVVSLHAPGGRVLLDDRWLSRPVRPMVLVNTARADLIDEQALALALRQGRVAALGTDTVSGDLDGGGSPLLAPDLIDRVTVTPHLGAQTVEAVDAMGSGAVEAVLDVLAGRPPRHPVPLPDADEERHDRRHP